MNTDHLETGHGVVAMLARNALWLALRGAVCVAFGLIVLSWRRLNLSTLADIFAIFAILSGGLLLTAAIRRRKGEPPTPRLASSGAVYIIAGIVALVGAAGFTPLRFLVVLSFWALVTGFIEIAAAMRLSRQVEHEWMLLPASCLSIVLGVILMVVSAPTVSRMASWLGWWGIVYGVLMFGLAYELWRSARGVGTVRPGIV